MPHYTSLQLQKIHKIWQKQILLVFLAQNPPTIISQNKETETEELLMLF